MQMGRLFGCHQMPSRSFFVFGYQCPLCARCTGVLIGQIAALFTFAFLPSTPYIALLLLPMAIDGASQYVSLRQSNQWLRLISGLLGGFSFANLALQVIFYIIAAYST